MNVSVIKCGRFSVGVAGDSDRGSVEDVDCDSDAERGRLSTETELDNSRFGSPSLAQLLESDSGCRVAEMRGRMVISGLAQDNARI